MSSLGNVDTGGFSKASIAAMQDSDYFNKPKKSNQIILKRNKKRNKQISFLYT